MAATAAGGTGGGPPAGWAAGGTGGGAPPGCWATGGGAAGGTGGAALAATAAGGVGGGAPVGSERRHDLRHGHHVPNQCAATPLMSTCVSTVMHTAPQLMSPKSMSTVAAENGMAQQGDGTKDRHGGSWAQGRLAPNTEAAHARHMPGESPPTYRRVGVKQLRINHRYKEIL